MLRPFGVTRLSALDPIAPAVSLQVNLSDTSYERFTAGLVLVDERLAEIFGHFRRHGAGDDIDRAAGLERQQ